MTIARIECFTQASRAFQGRPELKAISPNAALVTKENPRKDTVSMKYLAPLPPVSNRISNEVHEPMKNGASELLSDFAPSAGTEALLEQSLSDTLCGHPVGVLCAKHYVDTLWAKT